MIDFFFGDLDIDLSTEDDDPTDCFFPRTELLVSLEKFLGDLLLQSLPEALKSLRELTQLTESDSGSVEVLCLDDSVSVTARSFDGLPLVLVLTSFFAIFEEDFIETPRLEFPNVGLLGGIFGVLATLILQCNNE